MQDVQSRSKQKRNASYLRSTELFCLLEHSLYAPTILLPDMSMPTMYPSFRGMELGLDHEVDRSDYF